MDGLLIKNRSDLVKLPHGTKVCWYPEGSLLHKTGYVFHEGSSAVSISTDLNTPTYEASTFPLYVIKMPDPEYPPIPEPVTRDIDGTPEQLWPMIHGGTWAREKALECAVRVYEGTGMDGLHTEDLADTVLGLAERFEEWLDRDADEDSQPERPVCIDTTLDPYHGGPAGQVFMKFTGGGTDVLSLDRRLTPPEGTCTVCGKDHSLFGHYEQGYRDGQNSAADDYQRSADEAEERPLSVRLREAADTIVEARQILSPTTATGIAVQGVRLAADIFEKQGK